MSETSDKIVCLKGASEICKFIKEDTNQLNHLVKYESLPAWKRNEKGPWRALNIDLCQWLVFQREKYRKYSLKYIQDEKLKKNK